MLADGVLGLLQAVGGGVRRLSWRGSRSVSSLQLGAALQCVPGLQQLDCSHTRLSVAGLAGRHLRLPALAKLDLSGCTAVTDSLVQLLANSLQFLDVSGCCRMTGLA